ncbi:hypothetical protein I3842_09G132700 [Carya illinoinensis]|uniref:Uncharacterized protein n=1 Tax=Carya illinoinensis TaxID=32201 RepID=A0A922E4U7_CARIL|nr:hypothetical protein I3842_09G132700 [Carya illinoinensis]
MTFRCCDVGVFQTYFRTQSHPQVTRLIEVKFKTLIIHCKNQIRLNDDRLESEVDEKEAEIMVKVALLCTNASASLRPTMCEVVSMLEGRLAARDRILEASTYH